VTRIDHVLIATTDLELGARQLWAAHGLESVPGGRHLGFGTANRIVPVGSQYLELVAVFDFQLAATNAFGRAVMATASPDSLRPLAVCLGTDDLAGVGRRLNLEPVAGERSLPSGEVLHWWSVGMEQAFSPRRLPFFIAWEDPARHPATAGPRNLPTAIAVVEMGGDERGLAAWVGEQVPGLVALGGPPGVLGVELATPEGRRVQLS